MSGPQLRKSTFAKKLIELPTTSFQAYLDSLARHFSEYDVRCVVLLSPFVGESTLHEIIAFSGNSDRAQAYRESKNWPRLTVAVGNDSDSRLALVLDCRKLPPAWELSEATIRSAIEIIILKKKQLVRAVTIEQATRSRDVNTFTYRLLPQLRDKLVYAEEISLFVHDPGSHKLFLSNTTNELRDVDRKKDIYYMTDEDGPTASCFRTKLPIIETQKTSFRTEAFDRHFETEHPYNRAYWPVCLDGRSFSTDEARNAPALGVLRVTNLQRNDGDTRRTATFAEYDRMIIAFVVEVIYVLLQQYVQSTTSQTDYARLTHGLGANIDAAIKFASSIMLGLFQEKQNTDQRYPQFSLVPGSRLSEIDIYHTLQDLLFFLEDAEFQLAKSQGFHRFRNAETIDSLHASVLMPAARMIPAIAAVNSKATAALSNLVDAGSLDLPRVRGNREGYISVLRNLFENSIKYSGGKRSARIELAFVVEPLFVIIEYTDHGIGIRDDEREQIFVDGFRSVVARRTSNKGIGAGLGYARDVMRTFGGELECLPHSGGARFRIKMGRVV